MAKTTFEIDIETAGAVASAKDLREQFNILEDKMFELAAAGKEGTKEFAAIRNQLAGTKERIDDLNESIDMLKPEAKFQAFLNLGAGIASGFAAAQGAAQLFGNESEDLAKSLVKVQSAMALAEGIAGLSQMGDSFKIMKTVAVDAFKAIKAAITSTGIGVLVVLLGTIIAYWDDIKEAVSGVNEEQKKLLETQQASAKATEKELTDVSKQENILKLMGKTEKDILNIKIEKSKVAIADLEAQLATQESMKAAQIESAERNQKILQNIFRFGLEASATAFRVLSAPIDLLITTANKVAEILGFQKITTFSINAEITKLTKSAAEYGSKLLFDPEEVKSKADETIQTTKDKLQELKNQQAGFQLAIQEIDKQAAEKEKEKAKEQHEIEKDLQRKLEDLQGQNIQNEEQRQLKILELAYKRERAELISKGANNELLLQLDLKYFNDRADIENKFIDAEDKRKKDEKDAREKEFQEALDYATKLADEEFKLEEEKRKKQKEAEEKARVARQAEINANFKMTSDAIGALIALNESYPATQEKNARRSFKINKALQLAQATVNGVQAVQNVLADPTLVGPARYVAAAIAGVTALANINKIAQTKFEPSSESAGGGGGGGNLGTFTQGGGGQPPEGLTAQNTVTQLNPDGTVASQGQRQAAPMKAYVVESESRAVTERVNKLSNNSKIG